MSASNDVEENWRLMLEGAARADSFPAGDLVRVAIGRGMKEETACFVRESGPPNDTDVKVEDLLHLFLHAGFCGKLAKVGDKVEICPYGNHNFNYRKFTPEPLARDLFEAATQWLVTHRPD